jgi:hypothetical protein
MSEYSDYIMGEAEKETEKAYLAPIENFSEKAIWIPKSVVDPVTKKIKKWFIEKKNKETKDYTKSRNQKSMDEFFSSS